MIWLKSISVLPNETKNDIINTISMSDVIKKVTFGQGIVFVTFADDMKLCTHNGYQWRLINNHNLITNSHMQHLDEYIIDTLTYAIKKHNWQPLSDFAMFNNLKNFDKIQTLLTQNKQQTIFNFNYFKKELNDTLKLYFEHKPKCCVDVYLSTLASDDDEIVFTDKTQLNDSCGYLEYHLNLTHKTISILWIDERCGEKAYAVENQAYIDKYFTTANVNILNSILDHVYQKYFTHR